MMLVAYIIVSNPFNGYVFVGEPPHGLNIDEVALYLPTITPFIFGARRYKLLLVKHMPNSRFKASPNAHSNWYLFKSIEELDIEIAKIAI
jgi:hypothetical protein